MSDREDSVQFVVSEIDDITQKLANGGAADPVLQGRAAGLTLRLLRPLVLRETVTEPECIERRRSLADDLKRHISDCPGPKIFSHPRETIGMVLAKGGKETFPWLVIVGFMLWKLYNQ